MHDTNAAADAVSALLLSPALRREKGAAAREEMRRFSSFDYGKAWHGILNSALHTADPPAAIALMEDDFRLMTHLLTQAARQSVHCLQQQNEAALARQKSAIYSSARYRIGSMLLAIPSFFVQAVHRIANAIAPKN